MAYELMSLHSIVKERPVQYKEMTHKKVISEVGYER